MSAQPRDGKRTLRNVHIFFITAVTIAGCMFTFKLFSFLMTIKKDELAGFAYDPILVYGLVSMGFLFLLTWAWLSGQFRNIESVKGEMFVRFEEQERAEGLPLTSGEEA